MLIVDDRWLLIGPNRHGSLYASAVLQAAFPTTPVGGNRPSHTPLCKVPPDTLRGKTVVGIIRCPLRWYVSKWRTFWDHATETRRYGFEDYFWKHWCNPHGPIGKATEDLPLPAARIGGWSYMHVAYHCLDAPAVLGVLSRDDLAACYPGLLRADEMLCTETLCEDLARVFGDRVRPHFDRSRNASTAGEPLQYYSQEQLGAVRERDGWLVKFYPRLGSPLCC